MELPYTDAYKEVMGKILKSLGEHDNMKNLELLEKIEDSTEEPIEEFTRHRNQVARPAHWISLLRVMKMGQVLKTQVMEKYDNFVNGYQKLSSIAKRSADQEYLFNQLGELLYSVDDSLGQYDRLSLRMMSAIHQGMLEEFGINMDANDEFFRSVIARDTRTKLIAIIDEYLELCDNLVSQHRIMIALARLMAILIKN